MTMDLNGIAGILSAVAWPATVAIGLLAFRRSIADAIADAKSRITGVSVGSVSVELAAASELKPDWPQLEADVRRLTSSDIFDSATHSLFDQISNIKYLKKNKLLEKKRFMLKKETILIL